MNGNPLLTLASYGQSLWMDFIRRGMFTSGEFERLIEEDGVRGVTSNPSIFEKAIAGSRDYDDAVRALSLEGSGVDRIFRELTTADIRKAADLFRPLYDRLESADGFVSLEVSPRLAHDTSGTIAEARGLWAAVARPNVMIKVPATKEGLPAIEQLVAEGLNINITLLFGLPRYREVALAFLGGLEARLKAGKPLESIASVASFFLSRIDVLLDPALEKIMRDASRTAKTAESVHGQMAVASAKVAYLIYKEVFGSERFLRLSARGARPQRLLWASTSTKNPAYSDVKYVEPLIGPDTINTMPVETLDAYRDHGRPASRLADGAEDARLMLGRLSDIGIDLDAATQRLEDEGVDKFIKAFDALMATLTEKSEAARKEPVDRQTFSLGSSDAAVRERIRTLDSSGFCSRLWRKDPGLWTADPRTQTDVRASLGWLHVAEKMEESLDGLTEFAAEARAAGFLRVVLLGMGGSSLAPLLFERVFGPVRGGIPLTVLDTTDPATLLGIERAIPLPKTLFIVASKSGTTAEPLAFGDYFYQKVKNSAGDKAGANFVAITDPGTPLEETAAKRGFRRTFLSFPDIGGRYGSVAVRTSPRGSHGPRCFGAPSQGAAYAPRLRGRRPASGESRLGPGRGHGRACPPGT